MELINNVISFEGRRGTGKTSAMLSFRESLSEYKMSFREKYSYEGGIRFFVIDYIDASKLEQGEQLLELVLANMFSKLRETDRMRHAQEYGKYQNNELYRLFDEVYGSILNIKGSRGNYQDESPLRALTQLSNSQILQKNIKRLIKCYLEYMNMEQCGYVEKRESYLVITIDDLDMHFQEKGGSPFDMLETLHRYLMIPGVVILLSYNSEELYLGCEKHFADIYHNKYGQLEKSKIEHQIEHIQRLTKEYLKKVLPIHTRIHMISWKKKDYDEDRIIKVRLTKEEIAEYLNSFTPYVKKEEDEGVLLTPKQLLFFLKAENTGIYYDACGKKRHYAEVTGFRELAQNFSFYQQLADISDKNYRYKELLDELYFRFTQENLLTDDKKLFAKYLEVPIERRSKDILETIRECCEKREDGKNKELSQIEYTKDAEKSYSYGELLYGLYEASKNGWFNKELVWCILDSYTIMLTKYYEKMRDGESDFAKEKRNLQDIIGASVASSWSNLLLPKYEKTNKKRVTSIVELSSEKNQGEISYTIGEEQGFPCKYDETICCTRIIQDENGKFKSVEEEKKLSKGQSENREEGKKIQYGLGAIKISREDQNTTFWEFTLSSSGAEEDLKKQLQQVEILCMFFSDVYHIENQTKIKKPGFAVIYEPGKIKEGVAPDSTQEPKFVIKYTDACFNIFNFVHNLFKGEGFFNKLHEGFEYEEYFLDLKTYTQKKAIAGTEWLQNKDVKTFLEQNSLYKEYKNWFDKTYGLAMPIYSFDMMYNLFKRQYKKSGSPKMVDNTKDVWANIKKVYNGIGKRLKEEDSFYFPNVETYSEGTYNTFFEKYNMCPFIDYVSKNDAELTELVSNLLGKVLKAIDREE